MHRAWTSSTQTPHKPI